MCTSCQCAFTLYTNANRTKQDIVSDHEMMCGVDSACMTHADLKTNAMHLYCHIIMAGA